MITKCRIIVEPDETTQTIYFNVLVKSKLLCKNYIFGIHESKNIYDPTIKTEDSVLFSRGDDIFTFDYENKANFVLSDFSKIVGLIMKKDFIKNQVIQDIKRKQHLEEDRLLSKACRKDFLKNVRKLKPIDFSFDITEEDFK
jgi:hypothetical protein